MDSDICTEDDDDVTKDKSSDKRDVEKRISDQRDSEQREIDEFEEEERKILALETQVRISFRAESESVARITFKILLFIALVLRTERAERHKMRAPKIALPPHISKSQN